MALLNRKAIDEAKDLTTEVVSVPEWGGEVLVRRIMGTERDEWEKSRIEGKGRNREVNIANIRASLCALCMVDEQGNRLYDDDSVAALGIKCASALERVFVAAQKMNGLSNDDVEELAKNSESGRNGASTSGSRSRSIETLGNCSRQPTLAS
jgi:hypothetical protein